jgi:hypothetical protein
VLLSGQKLTLGLLAIITLEVVHFFVHTPSSSLLHFLNASLNSCSLRVFSTACFSASIPSIVSKWWPFSSEKNRVSGDDSNVVFGQKFPGKNEVSDGALS